MIKITKEQSGTCRSCDERVSEIHVIKILHKDDSNYVQKVRLCSTCIGKLRAVLLSDAFSRVQVHNRIHR